MKTNKKPYHLKTGILLLISMFLFNFSSVYGQETMKNAKVSLSFSEEDGAKKAPPKKKKPVPMEEERGCPTAAQRFLEIFREVAGVRRS